MFAPKLCSALLSFFLSWRVFAVAIRTISFQALTNRALVLYVVPLLVGLQEVLALPQTFYFPFPLVVSIPA
jgi:hypothetical protein